MILVLDNLDSFTYNLVDYIYQAGGTCEVVRNTVDPERLDWSKFTGMLISPGPGKPDDFNFLTAFVAKSENLPTLGVCLGHQALALHYGARAQLYEPAQHGKVSPVMHRGTGLFEGVPSPFNAVRYHSWEVVDLPPTLETTAWSTDEKNMGFKHLKRPCQGIQFHPESLLTEFGHKIIQNWLLSISVT